MYIKNVVKSYLKSSCWQRILEDQSTNDNLQNHNHIQSEWMLYSDLEKDDNIMLSTVFHDHDV